jgi:hypothetical protein
LPFSLVEALRKHMIPNQIFNHKEIKKKKWQDPSNKKGHPWPQKGKKSLTTPFTQNNTLRIQIVQMDG